MSTVDLDVAGWHRSSYSGGGGNANCVEVAFLPDVIAVRDSKSPGGGALVLSPATWGAFLESAGR